MVRSVLTDEILLPYLQNLAKLDTCTIGLILGQTSETKDFIIHFAKTPPSQTSGDKNKKPKENVTPVKRLDEISEFWVADHAKHVTRMLPGGMHVLGVFLVSSTDSLNPFHPKLRSILTQVQKQLDTNRYLYGNSEFPDKLVLNYCTSNENITCKTYNVVTSSVKPAEFKFQTKAMKWSQLESKFHVDQTFPIFQGTYDWPLKLHLQAILESIDTSLKSAVFLFDNEMKDSNETLESIGKKKKIAKTKNTINKDKIDSKAVQISIFIPCNNNESTDDLEIKGCGGFIRIVGQIACKLWLHPQITIKTASEAVAQDILRSLAARLEMHSDSLIDEESEDTNSLHEPPRRVVISIPSNKVMLSDYLFPGEGDNEALISVQELLDIDIKDENSILDVEGQADLSELYPPMEVAATESDENLPIKLPTDSNKFMYIVGFSVAFIVLLISLIVHFIKG